MLVYYLEGVARQTKMSGDGNGMEWNFVHFLACTVLMATQLSSVLECHKPSGWNISVDVPCSDYNFPDGFSAVMQ